MTHTTVAVVDYGIGNHASVVHCLRDLGFRVRVSAEPAVLDSSDVLVLPGVGAFPAAMKALHQRGLVGYLQQQARQHRPIIGICLGMQLLSCASHEIQYTAGLNLIPGEVVALPGAKWHIGWNTLECLEPSHMFQECDGLAYYFNHSYCFQGPDEYITAVSRHPEPLASVIRRGNVVGIQFHPEKSQDAGRLLLRNLIVGLTHA